MFAIETLHNEVKIITGMYKDSILIWNINSDTCVGVYMQELIYFRGFVFSSKFLIFNNEHGDIVESYW
jgi:hypothetical protein